MAGFAFESHPLGRAMELHRAGHLEQAEAAYDAALAAEPNNPEALHLRGLVAHQRGQPEEAISLICQAIAARPNVALYYQNLAGVLDDLGRLEPACASYRRALALTPGDAPLHHRLGLTLRRLGRLEEAAASLKRGAELAPGESDTLFELANVLSDQGQGEEALATYRQAIDRNPAHSQAHINLAWLLLQQGRTDEGLEVLNSALTNGPERPELHLNRGLALDALGRWDEAEVSCRQALALRPNDPEAHLHLASLLLRAGDQAGWAEYEWRWRIPAFQRTGEALPRWDGRTRVEALLVEAEQGLGDTIQFARFCPLVAALGIRVVLRCRDELTALMRDSGIHTIIHTITGSQADDAVAQAAQTPTAWAPLMSLPFLLGINPTSPPSTVPYLNADDAERWRGELAALPGLKVGLAWAGEPGNAGDRKRSTTLRSLAPLAAVPGVSFVSLQKGAAAAQLAEPDQPVQALDLSARLADFRETAAVVQNLDLVISVDTAVAHLAGALGRPVWILLPFSADWRWLAGRDDSPWYPTARLVRQRRAGDWAGAAARAAAALAELSDPTQVAPVAQASLSIDALLAEALRLHQAGHIEQAEALYRQT
ncbi:MAG: tetratricopeptide repeat protein, partial [Chloroflexota bacterium]